MGEKIIIGPMTKGLRSDVTAFNIDNDAFPVLQNAYQWRGRVKRKRGTQYLGRLTRYFDSFKTEFNPAATALNFAAVTGEANVFTTFSIPGNPAIKPGSISIASKTYEDTNADGDIYSGGIVVGTVNYATGLITILALAGLPAPVIFEYFPDLPVMGLETTHLDVTKDQGLLGFDPTYAYNISATAPYLIHDITFFWNPATGTYPSYTGKVDAGANPVWTPFVWNGENYQQFWTTNYEGALWTTNGIPQPYATSNIGMPYKLITNIAVDAADQTLATLTIATHGLLKGDFVFINEVDPAGGAVGADINFQTGYVDTVTNPNVVIVKFPYATLPLAATATTGMAQYLTNVVDSTKDCLKYYTGQPISAAHVFQHTGGWVNFCPPLSNLNFAISGLEEDQYYLVSARMIMPFKDRLLFIGPVIQAVGGSPIYLQDTVISSQNGTPYYAASFSTATAARVYQPLLAPSLLGGESYPAAPNAFWVDQDGLGDYISAGYQSAITTVASNEDVLIMGFGDKQARFVYTGSDFIPFAFYIINSELGSAATFSALNLDRGVLSIGNRGLTITSQTEAQRADLIVPDRAFQISVLSNGYERICAQRDYMNEWIYFTYRKNDADVTQAIFPNETLFYNYRDNSWAIFDECYTTYGIIRRSLAETWAEMTEPWHTYTDPWDSGENTPLNPEVVGGNQQGFVILKSEGIGEGNSLFIDTITTTLGAQDVTIGCIDHCLTRGQFIHITGCLGTVSTEVNGKTFQISAITKDTFQISLPVDSAGGLYQGAGLIKRVYRPFIQSKQFPVAWQYARKTRLGPQMYLLSYTPEAKVALYIYLSQDADNEYNGPSIINDSLVYSAIVYTSPETNNLQTPIADRQAQIWHRMNTSLIGDTVQVALTLTDDQMKADDLIDQTSEIELHSMVFDVSPSQLLS